MRTVFRLWTSLIVLGIALLGQAPPKDVNGWGKIKWGMTVAQIKALYGAQVQDSDGSGGNSADYIEKLVIKGFAIGDDNMDVSVNIDPKSKLIKEVSFSLAASSMPIKETGDNLLRQAHVQKLARSVTYAHLKDSLTQKYGRPTSEEKESNGSGDTFATWMFPSTVIRLYLAEATNIEFGILRLRYTATDKKALDKL